MALLGKKISELTPEEVEFLKEAATTLRREGERLERALQILKEAEDGLDTLYTTSQRNQNSPIIHGTQEDPVESSELSRAMKQYKRAWKRAEEARYRYIVQREALGFRSHRFVDKIYPLPPLRKLILLEEEHI